jgi:hypothetical protein
MKIVSQFKKKVFILNKHTIAQLDNFQMTQVVGGSYHLCAHTVMSACTDSYTLQIGCSADPTTRDSGITPAG